MTIRLSACLALTLLLTVPALAQPECHGGVKSAQMSKSDTLDDPPHTYGYAGVVISRDTQGFYFQSIEDGSPASKSGLKANDRLESFQLVAPHARTFRSISRTISYNPNQTIRLTISRNKTSLQIPLRVGSFQDYPNEALLKAKREERLRDRQGIHYSHDLIADAPEVPQVIEFFDPKAGPSSILLEKRLDGLKVLSLPLDAPSTQAKLKRLNLKIAPQVVSVDNSDEIIFPFPIGNDWRINRDLFYTLNYEAPAPGEYAAIRNNSGPPSAKKVPAIPMEQEITLRNNKFDGWSPIVHTGFCEIIFDGRGGHLGPSIVPLPPVAHTWFYHNQNKFIACKNAESSQALHALVRQTVNALNSNLLDTKKAASKLVGEAKLSGNSIKAGSAEHPGLGKFAQLQKNQIEVRLLSEACAVARVHHMTGGAESYFYLIDDADGWKISAIRTPLEERKFAPGFDIDEPSHDERWNSMEVERIRKLTPAQKASRDAWLDEQVRALHRSLMTDEELKMWFKQHQADLNVLAKKSMSELRVGTRYCALGAYSLKPPSGDSGATIPGMLNALELGVAQKLKDKNIYLAFANGRYSISGVLYSEDNCPPPIGPYGTIWTEKLANHWYLMRVIDHHQFPATEAVRLPNTAIEQM